MIVGQTFFSTHSFVWIFQKVAWVRSAISGHAGNLFCVKKCFHDRTKPQVDEFYQLAQIDQLTPIIYPPDSLFFSSPVVLFLPKARFSQATLAHSHQGKQTGPLSFNVKDKVSRKDSPAPFCVYIMKVTDKERWMDKNNTSYSYTQLESERNNKKTAFSFLLPRKWNDNTQSQRRTNWNLCANSHCPSLDAHSLRQS